MVRFPPTLSRRALLLAAAGAWLGALFQTQPRRAAVGPGPGNAQPYGRGPYGAGAYGQRDRVSLPLVRR